MKKAIYSLTMKVFSYLTTPLLASCILLLTTTYVISEQNDSCPSPDGFITQDTTWLKEGLVNSKFDCSDTDLVIDGAILTLESPNETDNAFVIMNVKNITFKNNGDIRVKVIYSIPERIINTISEPYTLTQLAIGTGIGLQGLSILSLFLTGGLGAGSILVFLGNLIGTKNYLKNMWGIVYNAKNSKPIPFVIVRLKDSATGNIISSTVTDLNGRYSLPTNPGKYIIECSHDEFSFPSTLAEDQKNNGSSLYFGEEILLETETPIDFNIPLDPKNYRENFLQKSYRKIKSKAKKVFLTGNMVLITTLFILNLVITVIDFNLVNLLFSILYFLIIILKLLNYSKRPKNWGIVYDGETKRCIQSAFVKLYNLKNRVIDTKITDPSGRYQFFVPKNEYQLLTMAHGYKFPSKSTPEELLTFHKSLIKVSPEEGILKIDIPLDRIEIPKSSSPFSGPKFGAPIKDTTSYIHFQTAD